RRDRGPGPRRRGGARRGLPALGRGDGGEAPARGVGRDPRRGPRREPRAARGLRRGRAALPEACRARRVRGEPLAFPRGRLRNPGGAGGLNGVAEAPVEPLDEDARLMLAFRSGDAAAFEALFRRWSAPLLRYLERMLRDATAAEDLVQEVFLRVHRARERYAAEARFSTWLYRIATNLALNELRRPRRRSPHRSSDHAEAPALPSGSP